MGDSRRAIRVYKNIGIGFKLWTPKMKKKIILHRQCRLLNKLIHTFYLVSINICYKTRFTSNYLTSDIIV